MSWVPAAFTDLGVSASDTRFRNMSVGADGAFYVTTPTKVFRSADGFANLVDVSPKVPAGAEEYFGVSVAPSGAVFVTLLNGGIYKSINSGASWTLSCGAVHAWRSVHAISDFVWLVGTAAAGVVRTLDGGGSFATALAGIKSAQSFTIEPDGTVSIAVLGTVDDSPSLQGRIYTTTDQGTAWGVKYTAPYGTLISGAVCDPYSGAYYLGIYNGTTKATLDFVSFTDASSDPLHGGVVLADRAYICSYAAQTISRSAPLIEPPNAPSISPPAGIYGSTQTVTLSTETAGASIYYTVDGSEPTSSSTLYTAPLTIYESTTVKAIAVKAGLDDSAVSSAEYTIIAGKFYIPSFKVRLHDDERFLTDTKEFDIGNQPIDIPDDNALRYVCAVRNGNSVSIQLKPHADVYSINFSNTVPLWRVARFGDAIHQINYNNAGDGLANKHEFMLLRTEPYRLAYDSAFSVVMDGRNISISAANVFFGHRRIEVLQFHSTTDIVTNWYHATSEWKYARVRGGMWPNDSYDNGADVVAMSNNQWGAVFLYRSIGDDKEIFYVRGSSEESNKEKARLIPIPQEPDLVQWHSVLVGRIIFQEGASTGEFEPYSKAAFVRSQTPSIALNDLTDVAVDGSEAGAFLQKDLAGEWVGNQLVWDDMRHLSSIKAIGTDRPEYVAFGAAFLALEFTVGDMVWCDSEQIPHGWNGGPIRPHIHICTDAAGGTGNMVWEVIIASRPAGNGAWSSGQTIQKTWTGTLGAYGVTILDLWNDPGVTLANAGSSTIMKMRLRLVSATFTGKMYLDGFDSHIQIKRAGTISEFGAL